MATTLPVAAWSVDQLPCLLMRYFRADAWEEVNRYIGVSVNDGRIVT